MHTKGKAELPLSTLSPLSIADREIKSNALAPSMDVTVVSGLNSVKPCSMCAPAFVQKGVLVRWRPPQHHPIVGPSSWPQVCE